MASGFGLLLLSGCPGEDITPPEVEITSPAAGDTVEGIVLVRAHATDERGVAVVDFYAGSRYVGSDSSGDQGFYSANWNTTGFAPGAVCTLFCRAKDESNNPAVSPGVAVLLGASAGTHHGGTIAAPERWQAKDNPHVIDRELLVEAVLTLEPGVQVLLANGVPVVVGSRARAGLFCRGKADSVISFSALSSTTPGAWQGIELGRYCLAESTFFEHCRVEYGGSSRALLYSDAIAPSLRYSTFRYSGDVGVACPGFTSFEGNVLSNCAGFGLALSASGVTSFGANNRLDNNGRRGIEVFGGTVTQTATWPNPGFPYCITNSVTVAGSSNPLLTIAAGCSLLFSDSARLRIGVGRPGGLNCDGTLGRITLSGLSSAPAPGTWRGIEFWEETDSLRSTLRYCTIENAGAAGSAAIAAYSAALELVGCRISNCQATGIQCNNSGFVRFESDTITGCAGAPLRIAAPYVAGLGTGNSLRGNGHDRIEVTAEAITRNAQWRNQGVPYLVNGIVEVGSVAEPTLTIGAGTVLSFAQGSGLSVGRNQRATLLAVGEPDSITFTGEEATPGFWRGLELHRFAYNGTRLERCRLLYGGSAGSGILYVDSCVPSVRANEIAYSSNFCVYLVNTELDPDSLESANWLHDWAEGYEAVYDAGRR